MDIFGRVLSFIVFSFIVFFVYRLWKIVQKIMWGAGMEGTHHIFISGSCLLSSTSHL